MQKQYCEYGKMNKRGWLQVVEASIAVIIMISFVMIIMNKAKVEESSLQEKVNDLVSQIEKDDDLRDNIFGETIKWSDIEPTIGNNNFYFTINEEEYESGKPTDKDVYSASIIINRLDAFKTFTLYIWK